VDFVMRRIAGPTEQRLCALPLRLSRRHIRGTERSMSLLSAALTPERPLRRKPHMTALIERFLPAAEALSKAHMVRWRGATLLAIANVLHSLKLVGGDTADLARRVDVPEDDFASL